MKFLLILASTFSFTLFAEESLNHTLSVQAEGEVTLQGTIADVSMGIEVNDSTPSKAQELLSQKQNNVIIALRQKGAKDIQVQNFSLYPVYDKDKQLVVIGYNARIDISFNSPVETAGILIDAAIESGANQNQGIIVRASDSELYEARLKALRLASHNAEEEARVVMNTLKVNYKGIRQVTINPRFESNPVYPMTTIRHYSMDKASSPIELTEQKLKVSATVGLVLNIE